MHEINKGVGMKKIKHMVLLGVFITEVSTFFGLYLFGTRGVKSLRKLHKENSMLQQEIATLRTCIQDQKKEVELWQRHAFYKEKIAREQLHMARAGDEIYLID